MSVPAEAGEAILELRAVKKRFGGIVAVNDVSMQVKQGAIHGLIGPNGSGKSTTFNLIAGVYALTGGTILFRGVDVTSTSSHKMANRGLARTFQATEVFSECSVTENLVVSSQLRCPCGFWDTIFFTRRHGTARARIRERVDTMLETLRLTEVRHRRVRDLPHRIQKAVALGNALAVDPALLMLDEPAAGLTHGEMDELMETFRSIREGGTTLLLVEHNMRTVMALCDRVTVLNQGEKIAEGSPAEVASDSRVIEAYLGKPAEKTARRRRENSAALALASN